VADPHLCLRGLRQCYRLVQASDALRGHQRPCQGQLRRGHGWCIIGARLQRDNCGKDTAIHQDLDKPEHRRDDGDNVKLGKVAMWHPVRCQVIEKTIDSLAVAMIYWTFRDRLADVYAVLGRRLQSSGAVGQEASAKCRSEPDDEGLCEYDQDCAKEWLYVWSCTVDAANRKKVLTTCAGSMAKRFRELQWSQ